MNDITNAMDKIKTLLDDNYFTAYNIEKETGIPHSKIIELRNHKRPINRLSLDVAKRLVDYYNANK